MKFELKTENDQISKTFFNSFLIFLAIALLSILYRISTNFDKIIKNAKAFIDAG